ncbi:MAG: short-chain dehydrogenase/oxidoreductase [uncultured Corynebacteriales bacterium]|uniref:Short-chain dehydrogenase/oxidoreductase n=1 Tax=uncultured Mycobacteriales bacterium TaxID=581187 RepID=A0A6J4HRU6_9ACTN|nr:MAG: short-chain dehydrogenase/oxidoreductase [uncultured Corynebacteriales bacterium]
MSDQRVALVTGASAGIGAQTARRLAERGFVVHAVARRVDAMRPLLAAGVRTFGLDVTDEASLTSGVDRVLAESGRLDVLVNNAGYGSYGAVEDVPLAEARRQFEVNVFGLARLTQLVLPQMRARGSGHIVNVSSIGGKIYEPLGGWYHATKFAVEGLSDSLRVELAPFGVDVVIVEPGPIASEWNTIAREGMVRTSAGGPYAARAARMARVFEGIDRSGRSSPPDVVARTIVRAATAPRPRTRYPVGRGAGTIVRARRVLPDRAMDAVIGRVFR